MRTDRRSYEDPCAVARALDVVGERWALLVVRELSLGPVRFVQLRAGLPHISPNVLSQRLRDLEAAGVVHRYQLDPPASTTVYELTRRGAALDPVLQALGRWGAEQPVVGDASLSAVAFVRSLRMLLKPGAADLTFGLVIGDEPFRFEIADGRATATRGRPPEPAVVLRGEVPALRAALLGGAHISELTASGALEIQGSRTVARRVARMFALPAPAR